MGSLRLLVLAIASIALVSCGKWEGQKIGEVSSDSNIEDGIIATAVLRDPDAPPRYPEVEPPESTPSTTLPRQAVVIRRFVVTDSNNTINGCVVRDGAADPTRCDSRLEVDYESLPANESIGFELTFPRSVNGGLLRGCARGVDGPSGTLRLPQPLRIGQETRVSVVRYLNGGTCAGVRPVALINPPPSISPFARCETGLPVNGRCTSSVVNPPSSSVIISVNANVLPWNGRLETRVRADRMTAMGCAELTSSPTHPQYATPNGCLERNANGEYRYFKLFSTNPDFEYQNGVYVQVQNNWIAQSQYLVPGDYKVYAYDLLHPFPVTKTFTICQPLERVVNGRCVPPSPGENPPVQ
ncbi:MAG: hypothetical protein KDD25_04470 [Bdellovibrionales bacterium]|nr:hypothetical protein [Bdellovibrionales bacterium]